MMHVPLPIEDIRRCSQDAAFVAAMASLYADLDRAIAARQPVCVNRGACCRFAAFGHHLFVTTAELAYFVAATEEPLLAPLDRSFCPYQQGGKCSARSRRPATCRIFFCDPAAQAWQPEMTEQVLQRLKALGERFGLPYAYAEWTDALRQMGGKLVSKPADDPNLTFDRPLGDP